MAPNLPDRYQPRVRLGRDGDVEEWLATDTALDRPVLVRVLTADAAADRRSSFVTASRAAASVVHDHLAQVYDVGNHDSTPHAIIEWTGGVSVADRLLAGEGLPADEFLANAAGLADGLAALHATGFTHGAIDAGAIHFSASHPAKLGGFGRDRVVFDAKSDTAALAGALRAAVTGSDDPAVLPSHVVEGLTADVDEALEAAASGILDAAALATVLHAIPATERRAGAWTWGWVGPVTGLVVAAVLVSVVGLSIGTDPDSPFLFPATPSPTRAPPATTTTTTTLAPTSPEAEPPPGVLGFTAAVYDPPPGDGSEHDSDLPALGDGDAATTWRTERYFSPLPLLKDGVGVAFVTEGAPMTLEFIVTAGTRFRVRWAPALPAEPGAWEDVASGSALGPPVAVQLPDRDRGTWLLWLVDLPEQEDGSYFAEVGEVTFRG